jgi:NADH:ubiquinone oxidoreductase subunit 6 (subunit J)
MEHLDILQAWIPGRLDDFLFYLLAIMAIPLALGVLFDRTIIRSGFLLIGVFGVISCLFLVLQAQFLALAQVMIYAVGITLVVVIALMLTNPRLEKDVAPGMVHQQLGSFLVAGALFFTIYCALRSESWPLSSEAVSPDVQTIGMALTTTYSLPFEFASVLLLAALVGAIMLAKAEQAVSETDNRPKGPPETGAPTTLFERDTTASSTR